MPARAGRTGGRRLMTGGLRRGVWIGAGVSLAAVAAAIFAVPVPSDGVLLLVDRAGGSVRARTGPGLAFRNPLRTRVVHLPGGPVSLDATWRVRPLEGAARPVQVHLTAGPDPEGDPVALLALAEAGEASPAELGLELQQQVLRAVAELPAAGEQALADAVRGALGQALRLRSLRPRRIDVEVVPGVELPPVQETGLRVLLVGIDAADWDLIDPLLAAGKLPNLARLRAEGAWGTLRSEFPLLSPLLWTTAATGVPPDVHGIIDFVMLDPATGAPIPISSHFRKVKAFWNILSDAGLSVDVVGWWATWPAEPVEGVMVTDRVAYSLFEYDRRADAVGATFPPSYQATAARLQVAPAEVRWEDVRPFGRVDRDDFRRSTEELAAATEETFHDSVNNLRRTLAGTFTYHRIALDLLHRGPPRLLAVYYQGLDEVNHRFAHLQPPPLPLAGPGEAERFGGAVDAFYELQDRLLGELLGAAPPDTTVMVLSDHGFANGSERPRDFLPYIEAGLPGRWHTLDGIWMLWGPASRPGRLTRPVRLAQVTPTLLRLLGLPLAEDMALGPVEEALAPSFLERHPARAIPTYEAGEAEPRPRPAPAAGPADDEMLARLRSLGYLAPSGPAAGHGAAVGATSANYHANLGSILLDRGELDAAAEQFRRAVELNPAQLSARGGLIEIDIAHGHDAAALDATLRMFRETTGYDPVFYYLAAQLFRRTGRLDDGLRLYRTLAADRPQVAQVHTGLGLLLQEAGDEAGAAAAYREALDRKPDALFALQELYTLDTRAGRLGELRQRLEAAIAASPRAILPYNWMGLVLRRMGREAEAEAQFREALELAPDSVRTLVNLSSLLVDGGRAEEAIPLLRRALQLEPSGPEPRINLIVALGRAGRLEEARAEFAAAGGAEEAGVELLNAMAFAAYLNGAGDQARGLLERSLGIEPRQQEARRLLDRLGGER